MIAIRLVGTDGITATRRITSALGERTKVIVLTTLEGEEYEHQARVAGASAFLQKRASAEELIAAVRAAMGGEPSTGAKHSGHGRPPAHPGAPSLALHLTEREREVLRLVADGLSNSEIATQLAMSVDTVKGHLERIDAKSGITNRARLAGAADASGFSLPPPIA